MKYHLVVIAKYHNKDVKEFLCLKKMNLLSLLVSPTWINRNTYQHISSSRSKVKCIVIKLNYLRCWCSEKIHCSCSCIHILLGNGFVEKEGFGQLLNFRVVALSPLSITCHNLWPAPELIHYYKSAKLNGSI